MSAVIPAPDDGSNPAIVSTTGGVSVINENLKDATQCTKCFLVTPYLEGAQALVSIFEEQGGGILILEDEEPSRSAQSNVLSDNQLLTY